MKKIFLSLAAMLTFGIASAQISPTQPQQTQPDPVNTTNPANPKKDTNVKNDVLDPAKPLQGNEVPPRKDELKTRDHVKSTQSPATVKDSADTRKKSMKPKRKA